MRLTSSSAPLSILLSIRPGSGELCCLQVKGIFSSKTNGGNGELGPVSPLTPVACQAKSTGVTSDSHGSDEAPVAKCSSLEGSVQLRPAPGYGISVTSTRSIFYSLCKSSARRVGLTIAQKQGANSLPTWATACGGKSNITLAAKHIIQCLQLKGLSVPFPALGTKGYSCKKQQSRYLVCICRARPRGLFTNTRLALMIPSLATQIQALSANYFPIPKKVSPDLNLEMGKISKQCI